MKCSAKFGVRRWTFEIHVFPIPWRVYSFEGRKKYISRIFDIHVKDVTGTTRLGYSLEVGRGVINFPAFVKMLRNVSYMGVCSFEHEKDMTDPFMGIAESIGYFRGVIKATKK